MSGGQSRKRGTGDLLIRDEFLKMLRCPVTLEPLALADAVLLAQLNESIAAGSLKNRAGDLVEEPLEGGLVDPSMRAGFIPFGMAFLRWCPMRRFRLARTIHRKS